MFRITPQLEGIRAQKYLWLWKARGADAMLDLPVLLLAWWQAAGNLCVCTILLLALRYDVLMSLECILPGPSSIIQASPSCVKSSFRVTLGCPCEPGRNCICGVCGQLWGSLSDPPTLQAVSLSGGCKWRCKICPVGWDMHHRHFKLQAVQALK